MPAQTPSDAEMYADDPEHPIPYLDRLDLLAVNKAGGGRLTIVIATPLEGDLRSLERLMRKLDNYLSHIGSDEHRKQCGVPDPANTEIAVVIDGRSDPVAFNLLEKCKPWVLENDTTLIVEKQSPA